MRSTPPTAGAARYFVERGCESKAGLAVLIADYRRRAERICACPMSREGSEGAVALGTVA